MSEPGIIITLRDIYLELRQSRAESTKEFEKIHGIIAIIGPQAETLSDHEKRVRKLERWMYMLPGSLFLSAAAVATAVIERGH